MSVRKITFIATLLLLLSGVRMSAQEIKARVAGLETNTHYMTLLERMHRLTAQEDSLGRLADRARQLYRTDAAGRHDHAARILSLENAIFNVRDSLGALDIEIGSIEQEWIVNNLNGRPDYPASRTPSEAAVAFSSGGKHNANLVYNDFFRDNLTAPDYTALLRAQESERPVDSYLKIMLFNQSRLLGLDSLYENAADERSADSLYRLAEHYDRLNALIADTLVPIWNKAFDTKVYTYNYLLDKFNRSEMLDRFEEFMVVMRRHKSAASGKYFSDVAAAYPLQKKLLLDYELQLADALGISQAADSLRAASNALRAADYYSPDAMPRKRVFMDFADAAQVRPPKYNSSNPVPEVKIYPQGTIYRILLGSYSKPQPYAVFKFIYPLAYERKTDRRYYYYAGGYPDYDKATAAAAAMKRMGFARPTVVAWSDGAYVSDPKPESDAAAAPQKQPGPSPAARSSKPAEEPKVTARTRPNNPGKAVYRVEIKGVSSLPAGVRDAIASVAPGKEVSRVVDPRTGTVVFSVGNFPDQATATAVAEAIRSSGDLDTDIIPVGQ